MEKRRYLFYLVVGFIGALVSLAQWPMYAAAFSILDNFTGMIIFALSPLLFVIPYVGALALPLRLVKFLTPMGGYWFVATYYGLLALIPYYFIKVITVFTGSDSLAVILPVYGRVWVFILGLILLYGYYKATHPVYRYVDVQSDKVDGEVTIAFLSDIHLGAVLGKPFVQKLKVRLEQLGAQIVLFGGDIIDGNLSFVLKDGSLNGFAQLGRGQGRYMAVLGNHDYYGMNVDKERQVLEAGGIECLIDERKDTGVGISITGAADYLLGNGDDVPIAALGQFNVFVEHEPVRIEQAALQDYDLYVSGHTHAGQFWPNRLGTRHMFLFDYGTRFIGKMTAVVSSGYGSWGALFRTGPSPEIVVIRIKNKKINE